ncbi:MAG: hypothetical protein E4H08_06065 [Candidatus Atribacteria bacterium]|nr:MAG: hypothetical protein E4H08_06065 [Candidatus Atribacteria bacterium]
MSDERGFAKLACAVLDAKLSTLCSYFHVRNVFPKVKVVLVPDRKEFDRLVRDLLRMEIEIPLHPAWIAQPQRTDMVVLSPSASGCAVTLCVIST